MPKKVKRIQLDKPNAQAVEMHERLKKIESDIKDVKETAQREK